MLINRISSSFSSLLCATTLLSLFMLFPLQAAERLEVGQFSAGDLSGWQQKEFAGLTRYRLVTIDGEMVLASDSQASASAYYFKRKIDLNKTPVMNWSWRKQSTLNPGDEAAKAGDDFIARLYVIRDGGLFFWKTKAINYVWSYQHSSGDAWDNPFAGSNARMISLRDASDAEKLWYHESRNVRQDFRELLGEEVDAIDGVAIMTDSDNSGLSGSALYGDIYFTAN